MSDDDKPTGYGRPPKNRQFPPGTSGNPGGRPKKVKPAALDLFEEEIPVREGGKEKRMQPKEVALRKILTKALNGDAKSIFYLLDQMVEYGALTPDQRQGLSGVVHLSTATMPFTMARIMASKFGIKTQYSPRQLAEGRSHYLATCSEEQVLIDKAIGYRDLEEGDRA